MLFNLIGPMTVQKDFAPLKNVLSAQEIAWPEGEVSLSFEYACPAVFNEYGRGKPTLIDLVVVDGSCEPHLFIEAKLKERNFGGCSIFKGGKCKIDGRNPAHDFSLCYLHSDRRRKYWELLDKHGFLTEAIKQDPICILKKHYQFFREVLFALEHGGSFVLLSDERSPIFYRTGPPGKRGLMPSLLALTPQSLHNRIASVNIQQVVAAIKSLGEPDWLIEFERKYGLS